VEKTLEHLLEEVADGFRVVVNALTAVRTVSVADERGTVAALGWVGAPTSLIVGRRFHLRPRHERTLARERGFEQKEARSKPTMPPGIVGEGTVRHVAAR